MRANWRNLDAKRRKIRSTGGYKLNNNNNCYAGFFTSPSALTNYVGTASWYMTLISDLTAIIGFAFLYLLLKRFPGKDIVEIFNVSFGKLIGLSPPEYN